MFGLNGTHLCCAAVLKYDWKMRMRTAQWSMFIFRGDFLANPERNARKDMQGVPYLWAQCRVRFSLTVKYADHQLFPNLHSWRVAPLETSLSSHISCQLDQLNLKNSKLVRIVCEIEKRRWFCSKMRAQTLLLSLLTLHQNSGSELGPTPVSKNNPLK